MRSRPPQTLPLSGLCLVLVVNEKSEERVWEKQTKYFDRLKLRALLTRPQNYDVISNCNKFWFVKLTNKSKKFLLSQRSVNDDG